jgi:hypothetical protein
MKLKLAILGLVAAISTANATTIGSGGGTATAQFFTSTGVILSPTNATVQVGTYNGSLFTQFAAADATPMTFSTVAATVGRLSGNWADIGATANAFNGQAVWFRVTVDLGGGQTGLAYFSGTSPGATVTTTPTVFPTNGGGVGDSLNYDARNLTILGEGSSQFSAAYNSGTNRITIGVVPEPSTALLGLLGIAGLIRRRR